MSIPPVSPQSPSRNPVAPNPAVRPTPEPLPSTAQSAAQPQPDQFTPTVASGTVSPTGHPNSLFPVSLTPDGSLMANTLLGQQKVGQIKTDGSYQLADGQAGNIFQDEKVRLSYGYGDHPFLSALRATERQRAISGSEIPLLRVRMNQLGLSGRGIKVAIIDPYEKIEEEKDKTEEEQNESPSPLPPIPAPSGLLAPGAVQPAVKPDWKISQHSNVVEAIINDPVWGTAPGAQVIQLPSPPMDRWKPKRDELSELTNCLASEISGVFERGASQLNAAIQMNDPGLRVASLTWGTSRLSLYNTVLSLLNKKDENQNYKYPALRQGVYGGALAGTVQDRFRAAAQYTDSILSLAPVQQAFQRYLMATREASARGIIPVVSMANDRNRFKDVPKPPPGSEMNLLACSPYVIAVASSNTNQTPGYYADDVISPFSSAGDGEAFNPTIAAPGQEIGVGHPYGPHGRNMVIQGTSFSTPFTCGVIAMMLEANPSLTFEQIKQILQQSATPVMHSPADEGAGVLNPAQAIQQAAGMARASALISP